MKNPKAFLLTFRTLDWHKTRLHRFCEAWFEGANASLSVFSELVIDNE